MFRVSPGVCCAQMHATYRIQGRATNLYFHTHSVCEATLEADLNSCLTAPWPVNHSKPFLALIRTWFTSILSHVGIPSYFQTQDLILLYPFFSHPFTDRQFPLLHLEFQLPGKQSATKPWRKYQAKNPTCVQQLGLLPPDRCGLHVNSSNSLSSAFESKELMALGRLTDVMGLGPGKHCVCMPSRWLNFRCC